MNIKRIHPQFLHTCPSPLLLSTDVARLKALWYCDRGSGECLIHLYMFEMYCTYSVEQRLFFPCTNHICHNGTPEKDGARNLWL
ncbi:hypothetical protein FKM82_023498 [Ascaphus truei]